MQPHKKYKLSLGIGVVAALAIPAVPTVFLWLYPPVNPTHAPDTWMGIAVGTLDLVSSFAEALVQLMCVVVLGLIALGASILAFDVASGAKLLLARKWLCALPVVLAVAMLCVLMRVFR